MSKIEIRIPAMTQLLQQTAYIGDLIVDDDEEKMVDYAKQFIAEYTKVNTVDSHCEVLIAFIKAMFPDEEGAPEYTEALWLCTDGTIYNAMPEHLSELHSFDNKASPVEYVTIKNHGFQEFLGWNADDHVQTFVYYYEAALGLVDYV